MNIVFCETHCTTIARLRNACQKTHSRPFRGKIESVLPFWTQHLGFIKTVEVPEGDRLGFVILQQGNAEVMYQSFASVDKDLPAIAADVRKGPTFLYLEVDDLETVKAATVGMD